LKETYKSFADLQLEDLSMISISKPITYLLVVDDSDLSEMVKLGEGTFGEAFKGGGCVFKIVPMDGDFLVNAEIQKVRKYISSGTTY
jgi:hypothetical protein